jgi:hypothetical protein
MLKSADFKGFERKGLWLASRNYIGCHLYDSGKPRKTSVRIVPAEIRTGLCPKYKPETCLRHILAPSCFATEGSTLVNFRYKDKSGMDVEAKEKICICGNQTTDAQPEQHIHLFQLTDR